MSKKRKRSTRTKINKLKWVELTNRGMPKPKPKAGSLIKQGLLYEQRVADYLTAYYDDRIIYGQWIKYEDSQGTGLCQPDIIIKPKSKKDYLVVIEVKLSWKKTVEGKIRNVYGVVAQALFPNHKIKYIQICKRLSKRFKGTIIERLEDVYSLPASEDYVTLNLRHIMEI